MTADDDVDPGEPIRLLADLEEPVSSRLRHRVRNSIHRRHLSGDLLDFTILTPGMVLVTYVTGLFGALSRGGGAPDGANDPAQPSHHETSHE